VRTCFPRGSGRRASRRRSPTASLRRRSAGKDRHVATADGFRRTGGNRGQQRHTLDTGTPRRRIAECRHRIASGLLARDERCPASPDARGRARSLRESVTAIGRSCGAMARVCGRGVLSRPGPRRALHRGLGMVSGRAADATPDRPGPPLLAQSRPQDEPCGTSALGRVPPRPPQLLSGSARRTRSHPDPGRDPRPLRAHLGRSSPPGKGTAPDAPQIAPRRSPVRVPASSIGKSLQSGGFR
jgi:hypothetical protein